MLVSKYKNLVNSLTQSGSAEVEEILQQIKNGKFSREINLARLSGKTTDIKDPKGALIIVDLDFVKNVFDNVLNKYIEDAQAVGATIVWISSRPVKISNFNYEITVVKDKIDFLTKCYHSGRLVICCTHGTAKIGDAYKVSLNKFNMYNYIKSYLLEAVAWSGVFPKHRTLKGEDLALSGYIYMDIDNFNDKSANEIWSILTDENLTFIKAIWRSMSNKGLGFLIHVDNLNPNNIKSTWAEYQSKFNKLGISIDISTKDVTRLNIISYDSNIFIRENTLPVLAVEPLERKQVVVSTNVTDFYIAEELIFNQLKNLCNNPSLYNKDEQRYVYALYQRFFSIANQNGVDINTVFAILDKLDSKFPNFWNNSKYSREDIINIGQRQYDAYASQHASIGIDSSYFDNKGLFTVVGTNFPYNGDESLKLEYLIKTEYVKDFDKKSFILAVKAKRTGISKDLCIAGFEKFKLDTSVIDKVYNQLRYPFGVKMVINKTKVEEYLNENDDVYYKEKGFHRILADYSNNPLYANTLIEGMVKTIPNFNTVNKLKNCYKFIKKCHSILIPRSTAEEVAKQYFSVRLVNFCLYDCYDLQLNPLYGYEYVRKQIITKNNNWYTLPNDKKLSDLVLDIPNKSILWADTNMGKTTRICKYTTGKRIILVPVISSLLGIENSHNASVFYGDKKNIKETDELIVSTYSSFPTLYEILNSWSDEAKPAKWDLWIDEQHNFAASAEKEFRNKELNFILDHLNDFKTYRMVTGTFFEILHPTLQKMNLIRVKWAEQPVINYNIVYYKDKLVSMLKNLVVGKKNIIYLQNKKMHGKLGKLIAFLNANGWSNIQVINASQKDSPEFKTLINTERFLGNPEIVICTSVIGEAINILDEDVATVHFLTVENPLLMVQVANRMRVKLPEMVYVYWKAQKDKDQIAIQPFDNKRFQLDLITKAENIISVLPKPKNKNTSALVDTELLSQKVLMDNLLCSNLFRITTSGWKVDYLSIAKMAFETYKNISNTDVAKMKDCLNAYGWHLKELVFDTDQLDIEQKSLIEADVLQYKEDYELESSRILNTVIEEGLELTLKTLNSKTNIFVDAKYPDVEWDIRKTAAKFSKYMDWENTIKLTTKWVIDGMSKQKLNTLMRQLRNKQAEKHNLFNSTLTPTHPFSKEIYEWYNKNKGKTYDQKILIGEIKKIVQKYKIKTDLPLDIIIGKYFEVNPILVNGELQYQVGGLNNTTDNTIINKHIRAIFDEYFETGDAFDVNFLMVEMNKIKNGLPILSKIPNYNNITALKKIKDIYELKNTSTRMGSKTNRAYRIIGLEPTMIKDIELI